ncbi:putative bifunctional diguanylate cyclase/phosphodiesterase [Caldimonas tepidiphila]|uniref:putative bifunctional diguanylate cyclase/phosphodiesterase n=1 Tax=Caldimonas tepidiphila TaxID=2315841 RepID=UPI000E5A4730|nr:EAL domain-containing protein [Caldimonas tepidiphila]
MKPLERAGDEADLGQPSVLLVDDDEVGLLLTSIALRDRGFSVTEVPGGAAALRLLAGWTPDMVVLDALMPGMDGFAVCRTIRATPGLQSVPILLLTGLDDEASILRAYEAGATDFFVKCNQWSLLAGRLRYMLRSARTRQELERSKAKLARAQDLARMGSFDWRARGGGLAFSTEALRVLGLAPGDALGLRGALRLVCDEARSGLVAVLREVMRHRTVLCIDVPVRLRDGRHRVLHVEAEPEFSEAGALSSYTGIVQDVTDRRMAEDTIKHLANFDPLTGLPNRRQLIWRAERAIEQARQGGHSVGLLLIDLDRFKVINDTLGHGAGDELLVEVGRRLRACVRHSDQVLDASLDTHGTRTHRTLEAVGRLGGDEFVALLPEIDDEKEGEAIASRILEALREPVLVGGQECFVTASVGIAMFPRDGHTVADLLRNSDVAMYAAKSEGRNGASPYRPHLAGKGREKLELESALHKALERGELVLHYQPKVDVRGARMVGAEALMRWQRGGRLVPPADFIPLAEETGLITEMSHWAIGEALRQADAWRRAFGFDAAIAVNVPSRLFQRPDLVERTDAMVRAHGLSHRCIALEITETGLMKNLQTVIPALRRLNGLGVDISIDDFGTGYSSLAYLTTLPIREVKIDRSFVRDLGITPESSAVVTAIIALARSLGLRVVAEGVESMLQMEVLNQLGCSVMQGFLFSRPLPAPALEDWLRQVVLPRQAPWIGAAGTGAGAATGSEAARAQPQPQPQPLARALPGG